MADTSLIFNIIARDQTGEGFSKVKAGALAAGAAAGAVLMSGIQTAIEKSKIDQKVAAQLGATPAQAAEIGKLSGAVYAAGFGEDLTQVGAAIKAGAQNGLLDLDNMSKEAAQKVTGNLLTVGTILEEDTERVSSAVSQMLRTGLAGSAEEAMDILVTATQKGLNKSQDLLDTVNEYGTQFRKLGLDGTTAMGLISQAIQAGARDSDTAADAIKEFSIRATDGSKASTAAFEALGMNAKEMTSTFAAGGPKAAAAFDQVINKIKGIEDPAKRGQVAVGLFGTKAEDLGDALFAMNMGTAAQQMGEMDGATSKAAATATSGAAGWSVLGRQFQMALVDTLNKALPAVNAVFGFMQRNSSWVEPLAIGLGVMAVAIGIATAATWAWNAALALNPVTWIVLGIVALIAVIVLVATKTRFFQTIWEAVWGFFKMVGAWFAGPFANFFVSTWNKITASFGRAKQQFFSIIGGIKGFFVGLGNSIASVWSKVVTKTSSIVAFFRSVPGKIRSALSNMFAPLWSGFKGIANRIIGGWNNMSFSIGGGSFMGVDIPRVSLDTPNIPYLATGGDIQRTGLAVVHQGERITKAAVARRSGPGTGSGGGGGGATIRIEGSNAKAIRVLLELLREGIRDQGGDVVRVLTPR
jgi:hypothetical protein